MDGVINGENEIILRGLRLKHTMFLLHSLLLLTFFTHFHYFSFASASASVANVAFCRIC
jgi:hypothetical protein